MRRFLVVFLLLVAGVVGLGFYLGWFRLSTDHTDQKTNITISVDQDKIQEDKEKAKEKLQGVGERVKGKVAAPAEKAKEESPRP